MGEVVRMETRAGVDALALFRCESEGELIVELRRLRGVSPLTAPINEGALALARFVRDPALDVGRWFAGLAFRTGITPDLVERLLAGEVFPDSGIAAELGAATDGLVTFELFERGAELDAAALAAAHSKAIELGPVRAVDLGAVQALADAPDYSPRGMLGETPCGPLLNTTRRRDGAIQVEGMGVAFALTQPAALLLHRQLGAVLMAGAR